MNFNKPKLITLLAIGLFVLGSGLNNAIAQTASTATLSFGTRADLTLNLILPITVNGKVYYFLDNNADGIASTADRIRQESLYNLLNNGEQSIITQEGNHNGSDDARSVIIRNYALILPTLNEYKPINRQHFGVTEDSTPPGWLASGSRYATSTRLDFDGFFGHDAFIFTADEESGSQSIAEDTMRDVVVAFQVIEIEVLKFRTKVFLEGAQ